MVFGSRTEATMVETDGYRLTLDGATGAIAGLIDKRSGKPVFAGPGASRLYRRRRHRHMGPRHAQLPL